MRAFLRFVVWLLVYLIVSASVFAVAVGGAAILRGPTSSQVTPTFDLGGVLGILSYGAFHWLLLAVVTFPIVAAPIALWMVLERRQQFRRLGRFQVLLLSLAIGGGTALTQSSALEYPLLKATPSAILSFNTAAGLCGHVLAAAREPQRWVF